MAKFDNKLYYDLIFKSFEKLLESPIKRMAKKQFDIVSCQDGVIISADANDQIVIIEHENNVQTVYKNFIVDNIVSGQKVSKCEKIGSTHSINRFKFYIQIHKKIKIVECNYDE